MKDSFKDRNDLLSKKTEDLRNVSLKNSIKSNGGGKLGLSA